MKNYIIAFLKAFSLVMAITFVLFLAAVFSTSYPIVSLIILCIVFGAAITPIFLEL